MTTYHPAKFKNPAEAVAHAMHLPPIERNSILYTSSSYAERFKGGADEPLLTPAVAVQRAAAEGFDALDEYRAAPDPRVTPASHAAEIRKQATRLQQRISENAENARLGLQKQIDDLQELITYELRPTGDEAELRSVLRSMDDATRQQTLERAIAEGDKRLLTAAYHGHAATVGVPGDYLATVKKRAERAVAADLVDRRQRFVLAREMVNQVQAETMQAAERAVAPAAVAAFESAAAKHDAAVRKLLAG